MSHLNSRINHEDSYYERHDDDVQFAFSNEM